MNDEIHNYHDAGIHPADDLEDVAETLSNAGKLLIAADKLLLDAEGHQAELITILHTTMDYVEQMVIERNAWRFKAEELEKERNQWVAEWGDLKTALQKSRRLAAELGIKLGESRCPECGSRCLALLHGMFPTGVTGPDGEQETWYECAINCQDCGHVEEVTA